MKITINSKKYEESELLDAWRRGNEAGEGYAVGGDDDTPREAAESELLEDIQEITPDGVVACADGHRVVVIANCNGSWAVDVTDALAKTSACRVIFDNAGGVILQLGTWAHFYQDAREAADDVRAYMEAPSTAGWDGHEDEALDLDPTLEDIDSGGYRIWELGDMVIHGYGGSVELVRTLRQSWGNIGDFFDALYGDAE